MKIITCVLLAVALALPLGFLIGRNAKVAANQPDTQTTLTGNRADLRFAVQTEGAPTGEKEDSILHLVLADGNALAESAPVIQPYALALALLASFVIFIVEILAFRFGTAKLKEIGIHHGVYQLLLCQVFPYLTVLLDQIRTGME